MRVLITGVAGLLGSRFAEYLLKDNHEVIGIDCCKDWGNTIKNVPEGISMYVRDLSTDNISDIFEKHKPEYVYHFAAYAAEGLSPFIRVFNYQNNVVATANVINNCIKNDVKRLIFTSSMSVYGYGEIPGASFDETDQPLPIDPYAVAKYACELDIKIAGEQHNLDWCIIRPHNVFGRNQNLNDRYRNVLGIWMHQIIKGEPITIYGDGNQTRAFTEIENLLPMFLKCATDEKCSKQIFNMGGVYGISINQAAELLCEISGCGKNNIQHLEKRHEVKDAVPSPNKSIDMLGYKDVISFEDGLKNMWEWASNNTDRIGDWYMWNFYEIDNKLYSYWKNN